MSWRDRIGRALTAIPYRRFEAACRDPETAQARVWRECRRAIAGGTFWRGFFSERGGIPERIEDFPITTYPDYRPAIQAAFRGSTSPLTGDRVIFWCTSSGTSGARKFFPLTRAQLRQSSRTAAPQFNRLLREHPGFFDGKTLSMAAPYSGERAPTGIPIGLLSTSLYLRAPATLDRMLAIPAAVMRSSERFETWASLYAMTADLSAIVGMTPLGTVRLLEAIERDWDRNRAVFAGERVLPAALPPLRLSRARRRHLRALFAEPVPADGRRLRSINRLWPKLRAIFGWKSSICAAQLPLLEAYLSEPTPLLDGQYSATEAWFNVPLTRELGGPLHLGAHVFEFLPVDAPPDPALVRKPWELEPGSDYEILVTNAMGLVRYRIFDVVRCEGYHRRSPIVSFQSKARGLLGLDAATVRESEVVRAMTEARIALDGTVLCSPSPEGDRLAIFHLGRHPIDSGAFETRLRAISETYARSREKGDTAPPATILVSPGTPEAAAIFPGFGAEGIRAQEKAAAVTTRCPLDPRAFRSLRDRS